MEKHFLSLGGADYGSGCLELGNGNPLQYSCLENPMDRGAWRAIAHGVTRVGHDLATKPQPHGADGLLTKRLYFPAALGLPCFSQAFSSLQ